eukprot:jgi/Bigna1/86678/estExt_fgenesh1_pg.C_120241
MKAFAWGYSLSPPKKESYLRPQRLRIVQGTRRIANPSQRTALAPKWKTVNEVNHQQPVSKDNFNKNKKFNLIEAKFGSKNDDMDHPAWIAYAKKVLRFDCYFEDTIDEQKVIRHCKIYYFLEDGTMQIREPFVENCAIPQGSHADINQSILRRESFTNAWHLASIFLKRHMVAKGRRANGQIYYFGVPDFKLGSSVKIYGRTFHITGCDGFTKQFFEEHKLELGEPATKPKCPFQPYFGPNTGDAIKEKDHRLRKNDLCSYLDGAIGKPNAGRPQGFVHRFMQFDRKVLRFFCTWVREETALYDEKRVFVLYYFLSDGTVKVCEVHDNNSGREPLKVLLKRCLLPKDTYAATKDTGRFGPPGGVDYYTDADFKVGTLINVYGRRFKLCACDKFTEDFYLAEYKFKQPSMMPEMETAEGPVMLPPEGTGFGTPEDSLSSFLNLVPRQSKKDFDRFVKMNGVTFRWTAELVTRVPDFKERRFCLKLYPEDDSIEIHELAERNSGFTGGRFLSRTRCINKETRNFFHVTDIAEGKIVEINGYRFRVLKEERFTSQYKTKLKQYYVDQEKAERERKEEEARLKAEREIPLTRYEENRTVVNLVSKIREVGQMYQWMMLMDKNGDNKIDKKEFEEFLSTFHINVEDRIIDRLWRVFDVDGDGEITVTELCEAIERCEELKTKLHSDHEHMIPKKSSAALHRRSEKEEKRAKEVEELSKSLGERFKVGKEASVFLAEKYLQSGTFSLDDLGAALEAARMSPKESTPRA